MPFLVTGAAACMEFGKGESLSIYGMGQGTQLWPQVLSKIRLEL